MPEDFASSNLTHHFLIAMPSLQDEVFAKSVVYICEHSERGALGLVINKPCGMAMTHLFSKIELNLQREDLHSAPVFIGGPLQIERGFILHEQIIVPEDTSGNSIYASTMRIPGGLEMTTSKDVLEAISFGAGPQKVLVSLGYSAWGEGQLEEELSDNSWLTVAADIGLIFDTPVSQRYDQALRLLGVDRCMLSPEVGRA